MQTKTLASLKHAHIGPALAMLALAIAALGLSACGRVVPRPPKAAKATQTPAAPATIDLTSKALRQGDHFCYDLTAKTEVATDGKETETPVKDVEICLAGTETEGLYKVTTDSKELADLGFNGLKVVPVADEVAAPAKKEEAKPATKLIDESLMAASADAPKDEAKKEEKKPDHKERFAKAINGKPEKDGEKIKIALEFTGSLTEDASKRKKEDGTVVIQGKKYKYSRSKI
jgi:hypothetical protein